IGYVLPIASSCPGGAATELRATRIARQTAPLSRIPTGTRLMRLTRNPTYARARSRFESIDSPNPQKTVDARPPAAGPARATSALRHGLSGEFLIRTNA